MRTVLLVLAGACLLFVPSYPVQAAAACLLSAIALSWLYSRLTRRNVRVVFAQTVIRGFLHERVAVRMDIQNNGFLPIAMLALIDDTNGLYSADPNYGVFELPPLRAVAFEHRVWTSQRGMYRLGPVRLAGSDPLGLFPWEKECGEARLVFVYPRMAQVDFFSRHGQAGGPVPTHHPMFADSTRLRGVRPYVAGDDPRHLHWKASARTGQLQTKEYDRSLDVPFYVVLNLNDADFHNKRKAYHVERLVEAAAAFVNDATLRRFAVGFCSNGSIPADARGHFRFGDLPTMHLPVQAAAGAASQILSVLSVIRAGQCPIADSYAAMGLQLAPRCLVITPSLAEAEFAALCAMTPPYCPLDFWFLDEQVLREGRVGHRSPPPRAGVTIHTLPEYGDELLRTGGIR